MLLDTEFFLRMEIEFCVYITELEVNFGGSVSIVADT